MSEEIIAQSEHDSMAALAAQSPLDTGAPDETGVEGADVTSAEGAGQAAEAQRAEPVQVAEPRGIILNILQNSWVEIRDDSGKAVLSRVLKAGDQYFVPDRPDLTMALGNAGGVAIEVDGQALSFLGKEGQVRRNIPLDAQKLKNLYALQPEPEEGAVPQENRSAPENTLDRTAE